MKAAVPRGAIRLRTTPASTPSSNACRPGEGRPGIHTLGVGPFFGCARIPAVQKAMPAAMWPATKHVAARAHISGRLDYSRVRRQRIRGEKTGPHRGGASLDG
jgi:hypothetical protein